LENLTPQIGALVTVNGGLPGIFLGMLPGDRVRLLKLEMLNASDAGSFTFVFGDCTTERLARCQVALAFPSIGNGIMTLSEHSSLRSLIIETVRRDTEGDFFCLYDIVTRAMEEDEAPSEFLMHLIVAANEAKSADEDWCCEKGEDIEEFMQYAMAVKNPVVAYSIADDLTLPTPIRLSVLPHVSAPTLVPDLVSGFLAMPCTEERQRILQDSAALLIPYLVKLGQEDALAQIARSYTNVHFEQIFGGLEHSVREMLRALRSE